MKASIAMAGGSLVWATAIATIALIAAGHGPAAGGEPPGGRRAAEGVAGLGWNLVRSSGEGNVILSPLSVWEALAMTHAGARGATAAEIAGVLGMPDDREAIAAASEALRDTLAAARGDKVVLDVANRLWVQTGKTIEAPFSSLLAQRFAAPAGSVDFASTPEQARTEINQWVGAHTAGRIDQLLKPGTVTPLTRLVLSNAVYLKAPWSTRFDETATRPEPFRLTPSEAAEVPFMHRAAELSAGRIDGATLVEIPYAGERLSMLVAVPDAVDGVRDLLANLDAGWHARWMAALRHRPVTVSLPRFVARAPVSLAPALAALGMHSAFEFGAADFSGIDAARDLAISAVVHEGFVEVTEEGTEAAAATGVVAAVRSAPRPREEPLVVKADRPFVWVVVERTSGAMVFAGIVRDPRG